MKTPTKTATKTPTTPTRTTKKTGKTREGGVTLHDHEALAGALDALARDIHARFRAERDKLDVRPILALVGVRTGGWHLAQRLAKIIEKQSGEHVDMGALDIGWHRDDAPPGEGNSLLLGNEIAFDVTPRYLVVVDDVLYTGRTVRAAIDTLLDMGRPKRVRLAVVIDRGHKELPIHADHVSWVVQTEPTDNIQVQLTEDGFAHDSVVRYPR